MYTVIISKKAAKELRKISRQFHRPILDALRALASDPRPAGTVKLTGVKPPVYRIRVGNYRVVYEIHDAELRVLVVKMGDRKDVYR